MKRKLSLITAVLLMFTCFMIPASAFASETGTKASVKMYVYDSTALDATPTYYKNVEVSSKAAENAGFTFDDPANSGNPTMLDAMVALSAIEGWELGAVYNDMYGSASITKMFGQDYPACGYFVNNNSDPSQISCDTMQLKDGDLVTIYLYKDLVGWSDVYMFFDKTEYTAEEGETLEINVNKLVYDANWNRTATAEAGRTVVMTDGENTYEAVSDENGTAVFEDVKAGDYKATVKLASENEYILMPYAEVAISEKAVDNGDNDNDEDVAPTPEDKEPSDKEPGDNEPSDQEDASNESSPKTGDGFDPMPFVIIALISLAAGSMTFVKRRA